MKTPFEKPFDDELLLVDGLLNQKFEVKFALDTGCSNTTIDLNLLLMAGVSIQKIVGEKVLVSTMNGVIFADIYVAESLFVLGHVFKNVPIQVVDFMLRSPLSNYNGLLGLDILSQKNLCIHFDEQLLTFS